MAMRSNVNRQMTRRRARQKRWRKHTRRMISASIQKETRLEIVYEENIIVVRITTNIVARPPQKGSMWKVVKSQEYNDDDFLHQVKQNGGRHTRPVASPEE